MTQQVNNRFREVRVFVPANIVPQLREIAKAQDTTFNRIVGDIFMAGLTALASESQTAQTEVAA